MHPTYELIRGVIPTRIEKRRVAEQLGHLNESTLYKWCEDPARSGSRNPVDILEVLLDHGMTHHPDEALALLQHLDAVAERPLTRRAQALTAAQLVVVLQPGHQKELYESVAAFSAALRCLVMEGDCDLDGLLQEVLEAGAAVRKAEVMIRALIEADKASAEEGA
jgi:hypothetical protein